MEPRACQGGDDHADAAKQWMINMAIHCRQNQPAGGSCQQDPGAWTKDMEDPVRNECAEATTKIVGRFIVYSDGM